MPDDETDDDRLARLTQELKAIQHEASLIGRSLAGYYVERDQILDAIKSTHHTREFAGRTVVVGLDRTKAVVRSPLFENLDRLNQLWAPEVEQRRRLNAQARALQGEVRKLNDYLMKQRAKAAKASAIKNDAHGDQDDQG